MFAFHTPPPRPTHSTFPENIRKHITTCFGVSSVGFNPLSAIIKKWSNTLKQFVVGKLCWLGAMVAMFLFNTFLHVVENWTFRVECYSFMIHIIMLVSIYLVFF